MTTSCDAAKERFFFSVQPACAATNTHSMKYEAKRMLLIYHRQLKRGVGSLVRPTPILRRKISNISML